MADVVFGDLIIGDINHRIIIRPQFIHQRCTRSRFYADFNTDINLRLIHTRVSIIKFRDRTTPQQRAETLEAARLFRNGDRENNFAAFTDFRHFRDVTQTVKIHVGTAENSDQFFIGALLAFDVFFDPGQSESTGWFGNRPGIIKGIFDRRADFIRGNGDDFIDILFADLPGVLANLCNRHTIGKDTDLFELNATPSTHGRCQTSRLRAFNTDDFYVRGNGFDVGRHTGNQAATAHRNKHRIRLLAHLLEDFNRNGALTGNRIGVIVGVNVGVAFFFDQFL